MQLIECSAFVLHIRSMTTNELCKAYPSRFSIPVWKGDRSEMVKDMLALDAIKWDVVGSYAKFLRQKLELWMFVPCDAEGNVLDNPSELKDLGHYDHNENDDREWDKETYKSDLDAYQQSKSRCLFEGFEVVDIIDEKLFVGERFQFNVHRNKFEFYEHFENKMPKYIGRAVDIEDLVPYGLTLTATAIKKIGL